MVPTENLRFRNESLSFKIVENAEDIDMKHRATYKYPSMRKTMTSKDAATSEPSFILDIEAGSFSDCEINVLLGENGMGKTTFIRMLAGLLKPDDPSTSVPALQVSYKPQKLKASYKVCVDNQFHFFIKQH